MRDSVIVVHRRHAISSIIIITALSLLLGPSIFHAAMYRRLTRIFSTTTTAFHSHKSALSTIYNTTNYIVHSNHLSTTTSNMKFLSPLVLLSFAPTSASAWSTAAPRTFFATTRTVVPATILHSYTTVTSGEAATESFRLSFNNESADSIISPWHDIPLKGSTAGTYNAVIEIPKMTKAKMEVATKEPNNPIAQDVKKGKLRDYHGPIFWNYGCIPQTWEDPNQEHPELKCFGDNDPIDVVEIGSKALAMGTVAEVKPLGVLAMIDDGELDWKVIAIATDDELAKEYNDIDDVPAAVKDGIREWFRWYKTPDDKPLNGFGFDEKWLSAKEAGEVIEETHEAWKKLRSGDTDAGKLWTGKA